MDPRRGCVWVAGLLRSAAPFLFVLFAATAAVASDRVELNDGRVIEGNILFNNDIEYYIGTSGGVERVPLTDVRKIAFGPKPAAAAPTASDVAAAAEGAVTAN